MKARSDGSAESSEASDYEEGPRAAKRMRPGVAPRSVRNVAVAGPSNRRSRDELDLIALDGRPLTRHQVRAISNVPPSAAAHSHALVVPPFHSARLRARFEQEQYLLHEQHEDRKLSAAYSGVASADESSFAEEQHHSNRPYQLRRSVHPPQRVLPSPEVPAASARSLGRRSTAAAAAAAGSSTAAARQMRVKPEFMPPEWITSVQPRRTPYAPQIGDVVVYFHQGHKQYVSAVQTNGLFTLQQNALPWVKYPNLPVLSRTSRIKK